MTSRRRLGRRIAVAILAFFGITVAASAAATVGAVKGVESGIRRNAG